MNTLRTLRLFADNVHLFDLSEGEELFFHKIVWAINATGKGNSVPDHLDASVPQLAKMLNCSKSTILRRRDKLVEVGLICVGTLSGKKGGTSIFVPDIEEAISKRVTADTLNVSRLKRLEGGKRVTADTLNVSRLKRLDRFSPIIYNNNQYNQYDDDARVREREEKIHTLNPSPPIEIDNEEILRSVLADDVALADYCNIYCIGDKNVFRQCLKQTIADWRVRPRPHASIADARDHLFRAARIKYKIYDKEKKNDANHNPSTREQRMQQYATLAHQLLSDPRGEKLHGTIP